jgi:tetratricopeptide (TPR) repeat protein
MKSARRAATTSSSCSISKAKRWPSGCGVSYSGLPESLTIAAQVADAPINPGNTLARYLLGGIDMCRAQYQQAFQIFNSTPLEKNPALLAFYTSNALYRLGRKDEASALIERYLKTYTKDEAGIVTSVKAMMLAHAGNKL